MNAMNAGSEVVAPVSPVQREEKSSKPVHTTQVMSGE